LQALFQRLGDLVLHLLGSRARPCSDDGQLLDRKRRVLGTPQLEERQGTRDGNQKDQEHGNGALANGECR
jgi:hypothetical protein